MHWSAEGCIRPRTWPIASEADHAYAAGYLFDPADLEHDSAVAAIRDRARELSQEEAAGSFVASLSTRRLFLRSFLPSVVIGRALPTHAFKGSGFRCTLCGLREEKKDVDLNAFNFERHKWGGVRNTSLEYVWFVLDRFAAEGAALPQDDDVRLLHHTLDALRKLPSGVTATRAEAALKHLRSNRAERTQLLEILATVDVLHHDEHPGFLSQFPDQRQQNLVPAGTSARNDRGYPLVWWRSDLGINETAVATLFGGL
jgi:hypothetical protein